MKKGLARVSLASSPSWIASKPSKTVMVLDASEWDASVLDTPVAQHSSVPFNDLVQQAVDEHERIVSAFESEIEVLQHEALQLRRELETQCHSLPQLTLETMPVVETVTDISPSSSFSGVGAGHVVSFEIETSPDELPTSPSLRVVPPPKPATSEKAFCTVVPPGAIDSAPDQDKIAQPSTSRSLLNKPSPSMSLVPSSNHVGGQRGSACSVFSMASCQVYQKQGTVWQLNGTESADVPTNSKPASRCKCGQSFKEIDLFCRSCGESRGLVMERCVACNKSLAGDEDFCAKCGKARQVCRVINGGTQANSSPDAVIKLKHWLEDNSNMESIPAGSRDSQETPGQRAAKMSRHMTRNMTRGKSIMGTHSLHATNDNPGLLDYLVHEPISPARIVFDFFGALLIIYDLYALPLQAVFGIRESAPIIFLQKVAFHYWNVNLVISFFLSYLEDGVMVAEAKKTFKHYLKTWFPIDVVVMIPDWIELCFEDVKKNTLTSIIQAARVLRILRLLRLGKLFIIAGRLGVIVNFTSELLNIFGNVLKSVASLHAITHLIACAWYFCANDQEGIQETWVTFYGFEDDAWYHIYVISLHWSLTQFTPASMNVQPQNLLERIFTVFVVIFGMLVFSYILGSISASMAELRRMNEERSRNFWQVRKFMRQHGVPIYLSLRIQQYLEKMFGGHKKKLHVEDVPIFEILSQQLKNELALARIEKYLQHHPLFLRLQEERAFMGKLVQKAITDQYFAIDDDLFYQGVPAQFMCFVAEGRLEYSKFRVEKRVVTEGLAAGEQLWIAEAALWMESWVHRGCAIITDDALIISVEPNEFGEITQKHSGLVAIMVKYSPIFVRHALQSDTDIYRSCAGECLVSSFFSKGRKSSQKFHRKSRPMLTGILAKLSRWGDAGSEVTRTSSGSVT